MNKKLIVAAALVFAAAGFMLAQGTLKAQDAAENSVMANSDSGSAMMNADNAAAPMADNAAAPMADNSAAPAAQ